MAASHRHPLFARVYPHIAQTAERGGAAEHRRALLADLTGRVLEIGAGHGLNFTYYPSTVSEVIAVEPEPHLRHLAKHAAQRAHTPISIMDGTAEALQFTDDEFDAAVTSLVLCSVQDQHAALTQIARVLRPAGQLRFYEHVVSHNPTVARIQQAFDATIYPALSGGCHCARDTAVAIRSAGFHVQQEQRIAFKPSPFIPAIPHILGIARPTTPPQEGQSAQ